MRILLIAPHPFFQERGTPIAERALLESLAEAGHELHVLTYHEGEDVRIRNCRIHRIPPIPGIHDVRPGLSLKKLVCDAVLAAELLRLVRRMDFDVVHAVEEAAFLALLLKKLYGHPYIYDMDSILTVQATEQWKALRIIRPWMTRMEGLALRNSLGVLAVCRLLEERALALAPDNLIVRLEDMSMLPENASPVEPLRQLVGPGPIVMYVGNLLQYQGIDLLLEGHRRALEAVPDLRLVLIGGHTARIDHYSRMAEALGIHTHTHFLGPRPHELLKGYLSQADVLVSPRISGVNTPMKIYSYLDSGTPLLATRLPTHTQVLDDDIACLFDPTPEGFARALIGLFENGQRRTELAERARARVEQEYSREAFDRKLHRFYDRVAEALGERRTRT